MALQITEAAEAAEFQRLQVFLKSRYVPQNSILGNILSRLDLVHAPSSRPLVY